MKIYNVIPAFIIILLNSCTTRLPDYYNIRGFAQGTTYSIVYDSDCGINPGLMKNNVDSLLLRFDYSLSTYNSESLISYLNRNLEVVPDSFMTDVFYRSYEIWKLSDYAFDITMGPLINAWGFGPDAERKFKPEMLDSLMQLVGMDKLSLSDSLIVKSDRNMYLDVNAIAQGYSVDVLCSYLQSLGVERCLVEVGGEVRTLGSKYPDKPWKVALDKPLDNNIIPGEQVQALEIAESMMIAKSQYKKASETINPKTGAPVRHNLLSATIIADDCISADAFATACMVLGLERSKELLTRYNFLEAYLIYSDENGEFRTWFTENMVDYLLE